MIATLTDTDIRKEPRDVEYTKRRAARAVLLNKGNIALLHVAKHNYYKLPGGGIEDGESEEEALRREVREETGCDIAIKELIGTIRERKSRQWDTCGEDQTSRCYLATVMETGTPEFTKKERRLGFSLNWVSRDEALRLLDSSDTTNYQGRFITQRDRLFIQHASV